MDRHVAGMQRNKDWEMYSLTDEYRKLHGTSRVDWVDYAKGFCIIFVVMMHSTLGVEKVAYESGVSALGETGWMNHVVTFARPFRMPDFFMISGLFLGLVIARPWKRYIDRKVVHFAYFYLLWMVIQVTLKTGFWLIKGGNFSEIFGIMAYSLIEPYGTLWFIYLLPVFFVVTRLLEKANWLIVLVAAAIFEILPVQTGSTIVDEFAARFVYFFAGYALARLLFDLANWARSNTSKASALLATWFVVNLAFTSIPVPESLSTWLSAYGYHDLENLSYLPVVSLVLGVAGAIAIVCLCAMLSRFRLAGFLKYLGANSIVVYLAFFFPMIVTRIVLLNFAPFLDLGTVSLIVTIAGVTGPVIFYEITKITGWGTFLFKRPAWAWLERGKGQISAKAGLHPAE